MYKEQALYFFLLLLLTVGCQSGKRVLIKIPNTAAAKKTAQTKRLVNNTSTPDLTKKEAKEAEKKETKAAAKTKSTQDSKPQNPLPLVTEERKKLLTAIRALGSKISKGKENLQQNPLSPKAKDDQPQAPITDVAKNGDQEISVVKTEHNTLKAIKHKPKESKSFLDDLPPKLASKIGNYTQEDVERIENLTKKNCALAANSSKNGGTIPGPKTSAVATQQPNAFGEECTLACKQAKEKGSLGPDCSLEALVQLHTTQRTLKGHGTEALPDLRSAISIKAAHVASEYFIDQQRPDWSNLSPEVKQKKIVKAIEAVKDPSYEQLIKGIGVLDAIHIFIKDDGVKAEAKKTLAAYEALLSKLAKASHESSSKTHAVAQAPPHTPL